MQNFYSRYCLRHRRGPVSYTHLELGASAYEKRGVAVTVPEWDSAKCIQCNNCAYVCPHATIRRVALTEEEAKNAPAAAKIVPVKAGKGKGVYSYTMAISPLDLSLIHIFLDEVRPGARIDLETYLLENFTGSFPALCRGRYGLTEAEMARELQFWDAYVAAHVPRAYSGMAAFLARYRAAGGKLCVCLLYTSRCV